MGDVRVWIVLVALAACETERASRATAAPDSEDPTPVLVPGLAGLDEPDARRAPPKLAPGAGFRIEDGPALHGEFADCNAFHACCDGVNGQMTPTGLACGLAPAAGNGDCKRALESVRMIFLEQKIPPPPGCE